MAWKIWNEVGYLSKWGESPMNASTKKMTHSYIGDTEIYGTKVSGIWKSLAEWPEQFLSPGREDLDGRTGRDRHKSGQSLYTYTLATMFSILSVRIFLKGKYILKLMVGRKLSQELMANVLFQLLRGRIWAPTLIIEAERKEYGRFPSQKMDVELLGDYLHFRLRPGMKTCHLSIELPYCMHEKKNPEGNRTS